MMNIQCEIRTWALTLQSSRLLLATDSAAADLLTLKVEKLVQFLSLALCRFNANVQIEYSIGIALNIY